jgi:hypothetical protein
MRGLSRRGFEGSGDAPALSGGTFRLKWGSKPVNELIETVLDTMASDESWSARRAGHH